MDRLVLVAAVLAPGLGKDREGKGKDNGVNDDTIRDNSSDDDEEEEEKEETTACCL